jgi:hypothetical protein
MLERQEFSAVNREAMVQYLQDGEKKLAARSKQENLVAFRLQVLEAGKVSSFSLLGEESCELREEVLSRVAFRLQQLDWGTETSPRLMLADYVCKADDSMNFMLALCVKTTEACEEIVKKAKSGRVSVDSEASLTWAQYAREFYTLVVHDILVHMEKAALFERCFLDVREALTKPPCSAKRSWPSKKVFGELQARWEKLDGEKRFAMTAVCSDVFWFIQACDVAMAAVALKEFSSQKVHMNLLVLMGLRQRSRLLTNIEVNEDQTMLLNRDYVMEPQCLEDLYKKSVWHTAEKDALLEKVTAGRYADLLEDRQPTLLAKSTSTWSDVERVASTLILEGLLQRHALDLKEEEDAERTVVARREAVAKKKKQKRLEAKKRLQEGVEKRSEAKRRVVEEERRAVLAVLRNAPSWDISCLSVRHTFFDVKEDTDEEMRWAVDW